MHVVMPESASPKVILIDHNSQTLMLLRCYYFRYFLWHYMGDLERMYYKKPADFAMLLALGAACLLAVTAVGGIDPSLIGHRSVLTNIPLHLSASVSSVAIASVSAASTAAKSTSTTAESTSSTSITALHLLLSSTVATVDSAITAQRVHYTFVTTCNSSVAVELCIVQQPIARTASLVRSWRVLCVAASHHTSSCSSRKLI
jgi:hypothetical protein